MVASVQIASFHGTTPVTSDITSATIKFKRADDDANNALDPIQIPATGSVFSWRKHTKLIVSTPPDNSIGNVRFFPSSTPGSGIHHWVKLDPTYAQASAADEGAILPLMTNSQTYSSTNPLSVYASSLVTSTSTFPSVGAQDYLVHQIEVESIAGAGENTVGSFFLRYDES